MGERRAGRPFFNEGPLTTDGSLLSHGEVRAVMIFVDFSDAPASEDVAALARQHTADLDWFSEVSYGRFSLTVTPLLRWYRLAKPASAYGNWQVFEAERAFVADAIAASDADVNYADYQFVFVVAARGISQQGNPAFSAFPGQGIPVDGTEIRHATSLGPGIRDNGTFASSVANHEFVHSLGLPDLYYETDSVNHVAAFDAVGLWDPMSEPGPRHLFAWQKWRLGWLDDGQFTCLLAPGQLEETLTPLELPGGKKAVVVQTGPSTAYVVEVRRRLGHDQALCVAGVLVYTVDSQVKNAGGAIRVQRARPDDDGQQNRCGGRLANAPFDVGPAGVATYEDAAVKVELLATDGSGYRVRVARK